MYAARFGEHDAAAAAIRIVLHQLDQPLPLQRAQILPDVPTLAESGLSGFDLSSWWGIVGPAGMPSDVVSKLNAAINKTLTSPEILKFMAGEGAEAKEMSPQEFGNLIHTEIQRWTKVGHDANISID